MHRVARLLPREPGCGVMPDRSRASSSARRDHRSVVGGGASREATEARPALRPTPPPPPPGGAAGKDAEHAVDPLLLGVEEVVRPVHRPLQGLLARVGVPVPSEQVEALREAIEELRRGEERHTRSGELDGEWKVVEAEADSCDRRIGTELDAGRARTIEEEPLCIARGQRRHGPRGLRLDAEALAAGDERAEGGARGEERGQVGGDSGEEMLRVVEDEKCVLAEERPRDGLSATPPVARGSRASGRASG